MEAGTRVLGVARQSSSDRGAATIETQVEAITDACEDGEYIAVEIVKDRRSGKYGVFDGKRESSAWFTDPARIALYDVVMVSDRDRIDRDVTFRLAFLAWAEKHGKGVVTSDGTVIRAKTADEWNAEANAAVGAQYYRLKVGEKRSKRARSMIRKGQLGYGSWSVPYGYRRGPLCPECAATPDYRSCSTAGCKAPEVIPAEAEVLREIARMILGNMTITAVCEELTERGVPTRRGGEWSKTTVSKMLTRLSEPYARAADGTPFYLPEIVGADELAGVRAKLAARSFKQKPKESTDRHDSTLLLKVAFCKEGHPLYSFRTSGNRGRSEYLYYYCHTCRGKMTRMDELDRLAGQFVTVELGPVPYMEPHFVPATGHSRERAEIERQMEDIESQVLDGFPAASANRILARLQARLDDLPETDTEARTELRRTGKSIAEEWESGDFAKRRKMLTADLQVKLTVWHEDGKLRVLGESPAMVFGWVHEAA